VPFSELVKSEAYRRSRGRCECRRSTCSNTRHKTPRCTTSIARSVHYHHVHAEVLGGSNGLSNCEALCIACHRATANYGRQR